MVLVTAIITTIGTDYLRKAIESVKSQTYKNIELIVCYDGNNFNDFKEKIENEFDNLSLLNVGPFNNANNARQTGIEQANGEYIALLDDDDVWANDHIIKNLQFLENVRNENFLLISNTIKVLNGDMNNAEILPEIYYEKECQSVANYLFLERNCKTIMQTSSFFFSKNVGILYPFDRKLKLHQDYDWVITLDESKDVEIFQTKQKTSYYFVGENLKSVSSNSKSIDSLNWGVERLKEYSCDIKVGFIKKNTIWFSRNDDFLFFLKILNKINREMNVSYMSLLLFLFIWIKMKISYMVKR